MKLSRNRPERGVCFAWLPINTNEGWVWLEHVHYRWNESWGWGSDGHYDYRRWISDERYNRGERAQHAWDVPTDKQPNLSGSVLTDALDNKYFDYEVANGRVIPPNVSKCAERNSNDPCRYPGCTCMNLGGSTCGVHPPGRLPTAGEII